MEQQKTSSFRPSLSHIEIVLLYLSITIGLYTTYSSSQKLNQLAALYPYDSGVSYDQREPIGKFYCGIKGRFVYAFRFLREGKLQAWIEQKGSKKLNFPPRLLPQFQGVHYKSEGVLHWSVNMFGAPYHFQVSEGGKDIFTPGLCHQLAELSTQK
ncbi:MAG: hypothetical protein NXH75_00065 [Halobacteriovoraceae bacterium]|nr:hypothetical protein [Halobacteriovoraceae bacterium]